MSNINNNKKEAKNCEKTKHSKMLPSEIHLMIKS